MYVKYISNEQQQQNPNRKNRNMPTFHQGINLVLNCKFTQCRSNTLWLINSQLNTLQSILLFSYL